MLGVKALVKYIWARILFRACFIGFSLRMVCLCLFFINTLYGRNQMIIKLVQALNLNLTLDLF